MKKLLVLVVVPFMLLLSLRAAAHEFWMLPASFAVAPGSATTLSLTVGENFKGDPVAFSPGLVAALRHYSLGQTVNLQDSVPAGVQSAELPVTLRKAGVHLIALDTNPSQVVLAADKFHSYLRDEGLEFIIARREAAGTAESPGRERFRRNVKTLVLAGNKTDSTYAVRTGQRLEIVPLVNPYRSKPGDSLACQVLFDGKPLSGALVKAWTKPDGSVVVLKAVSNAQGKVMFTLPSPGTWMIGVVHMIAATDSPDHDWDSYWGNLTFALPASGKAGG